MQILLTFFTIIAYVWGGLAAFGALLGLAVSVFGASGVSRSAGVLLLVQGVALGILPGAFLLARYLCR